MQGTAPEISLLENAYEQYAYFYEKLEALLEEDRQYWTERAQAGSASAGAINAQNYRQRTIRGYMEAAEEFLHALGNARTIFSHSPMPAAGSRRQGGGGASPAPGWRTQEQQTFERRLEAARRLCQEQGRDASHLHYAKPHDTRTYNL